MAFFPSLKRRRAWKAARRHEEAGRLREARDAYRAIGTPDALVRAGALSARLGDLLLARQMLDEAVRDAPDNPDAWFHLGGVCLELRDTARADECFHEALQRAPDRVDILHAQAVYYAQRIPKAGLEAGKRALATMLAQMEDPLRRHRIEALGFSPELPLVFLRNLALEQQLLEEVLAYFTELAAGPGPVWLRVAAHNHLGLLYANTGRYREAAERFRAALALNGEYHEAHYNLAMAHLRLHEFDAARTELSIYGKLFPRSPVTTFGMALLAETRGDLAECVRLYRFFLERQAKEAPPPQELLGRLDVPRTWVQHAREFLEAVSPEP